MTDPRLFLVIAVLMLLPPQLTANGQTVTSTSVSISVLSWNLHGLPWPLSRDPNGRMERVAVKIRELSPQIVALQEVWLGSQTDHLVRSLAPEWTPIFVSRALDAPSGGLLIFVRRSDRCVIRGDVRFDRFSSSAPAWRIWEGDGLGQKGILRFPLQCGSNIISVIDSHLQSQYRGIDYYFIRDSQLHQLHSLESTLDSASVVLIAGDFNTEAHEPLYSQLTRLGIDITFDARLRCSRGTIVEAPSSPRHWIDYILAKPRSGWTVSATVNLITNSTRDDPYSDHNGVFAHVTFRPAHH